MSFTTPPRHMKQPVTFGSHVEQDTTEHVLSCQYTIAKCRTGARQERPEFGWPIPLLGNEPLNYVALIAALRQFEPRAPNITASDVESGLGDVLATIKSKVQSP